MKSCLKSSALIASSLLLLGGVAWAQATAQLNGRVSDTSGAVLPGVTVSATQTDTGFSRTVVTDDSGTWVMPNVPIGPYRLEISLQGFRTYVQTGIVLQVNANPVLNASLALGNLEETVTVEGAAPLVDVRSAGIKEVVERERIVELPLQDTAGHGLIVLAGGAVNTGRVSALSTSNSVAISVAGGLRNGVEYQLDGAAHNSPHDLANLPFPFPDALQEFSVATGGLAAATGMHSSAAVNAVTKSGTNRFHGNGFEFFRDSWFNATSPFAPTGKDGQRVKDGLSRNQFGGTLGGPLVPDKLFFFAGYERNRVRQTTPTNFAFVPTAAMMSGDFTAYASAACNAGGPVTLRAPFVNNRIDPALFSPQAVGIVTSGWIPSSTNPCGEVQYDVNFDNNDEQYVARVDYQLGPNHTIFGRYIDTFERRPPKLVGAAQYPDDPDRVSAVQNRRAQMAAFGDTYGIRRPHGQHLPCHVGEHAYARQRPARAILRCRLTRHPERLHLRPGHDDRDRGRDRQRHQVLGKPHRRGESRQQDLSSVGRSFAGMGTAPGRRRYQHRSTRTSTAGTMRGPTAPSPSTAPSPASRWRTS